MKRLFNMLGLTAALLLAAGCAKTDTAPGSGGAGAGDQPASQEGEVGATSTEDNITPAGGPASDDAAGRGVSIGDPAPTWENLTGTDDKQHSLKDYADMEAVAVVFTCNECPVAKAYEERLVKLTDDYKDKKVQLVAINTNNGEAEELPAMKERAEAQGFNFPYLDDPSQETPRAYGATVTPHVFLLDKQRNVVYMGAIDDNQNESKGTQHYLRNAIDAVLAGEEPEPAKTKQFGCGIRYE